MAYVQHIAILIALSLLQRCHGETELNPHQQQQEAFTINIQSESDPSTSRDTPTHPQIHKHFKNKDNYMQEVTSVKNATARNSAAPPSKNGASLKKAPMGFAKTMEHEQKFKKDTLKKPIFYKIIKKVEYFPAKIQRRSQQPISDHRIIVRPVYHPNAIPVRFFIKPKTKGANSMKVYVLPKSVEQPTHSKPATNIKWTSTVTLPSPNPHGHLFGVGSSYKPAGGNTQLWQTAGYKKVPQSYVAFTASTPTKGFAHHVPQPPTPHHYVTSVAAAWPPPPQLQQQHHQQQQHTDHVSSPPQWYQPHQETTDFEASYAFNPIALPQIYTTPAPALPQQYANYEPTYASYKTPVPAQQSYQPELQQLHGFTASQYAVEEPSVEEPRQPKYYPQQPIRQVHQPMMVPLQYAQMHGQEFQNFQQPEMPASPSHDIDYSAYRPNGEQAATYQEPAPQQKHYPAVQAIQEYSPNYQREEQPSQQQYIKYVAEQPAVQQQQQPLGLGAHADAWMYQQIKPEWPTTQQGQSAPQWHTSSTAEEPQQAVYAWRQKTQDGQVIQVTQNAQESRIEVAKIKPQIVLHQYAQPKSTAQVPLLQQQQQQPVHEVVKKQVSGVATAPAAIGPQEEASQEAVDDITTVSAAAVKKLAGKQESMTSNGWTPIINNQ